jgi:rod shape-determining protein MreD
MRWIPFLILTYITIGLQLGLSGVAQVGGGGIDFILISVAFITINARRDTAMPACFILGLLNDLTGAGPVGTYALSYSIVALFVAGTDRALSVEHPFTHFIVTLMGGVIVTFTLLFHSWLSRYGVPIAFWSNIFGSFYTALLALPVLWGMNKLRKSFRFKTSVG